MFLYDLCNLAKVSFFLSELLNLSFWPKNGKLENGEILPFNLLDMYEPRLGSCALSKESRKPNLVTCPSNILLDLLFVFPKAKLCIDRRLRMAPYHSVVGGTQEVCHREPL